MRKHRFAVRDLGLLLVAMLVLAYLAFDVDIFVTEGNTPSAGKSIELDETLLLGGLLAIGLLAFSTRRHFEQRREMALRIAAEGRARELAYQDPLTGLANRRQFEEALRMAVASPPPAGATHAILMLDLNGFKQINDTYGHGTGDAVLVIIAQRLLATARDGDLVARLGGDEFVILARHLLGPEGASSIALRIVHALNEPITTGSVRHQVGTGIGIALLPADAHTAAEGLRRADVALYRAKAERRSTFRFFEEEMDRLVHERGQLERALQAAIKADLIRPGFRPSFDLRSGRLVGFEAVPRWVAEDGLEIPLDRFLPIAEETGLVHALASRFLELACAAALEWPPEVTLSVDVLPGQLKDRDLATHMLATLQAAGLDPRRLEIEIAESTIVRDLEGAKSALGPLRDAGVSIALDNFGTGYSSLYHMREFKLDKVKIDRRFTENLAEADAARMIRALAGLGQGLGLTVSAEGIRGSVADAALLNSGVEQGQAAGDLVSSIETRQFIAG